MKRHATANWNGSGKEGNGKLTTQTTTLSNIPYNFISRFGDGTQTNPEELIAAAHAGCFSMKLAFILDEAGVADRTIETKCTINFENGTILSSHLDVKVNASGVSNDKIEQAVANAKENCPVSKALGIETTAKAVSN